MFRRVFSLSKGRWFYGIEFVLDVIIVTLTYLFGYKLQRPELFPTMTSDVWESIILIAGISFVAFLIFKPYKCGQKMYMQTMFDLIVSLLFIAVVGVLFDFAIKGIGVWRRTIFYAVAFQLAIFLVYKFIVTKLHAVFIKPRDCIIIGSNLKESSRIAIKLVQSKNHLYTLRYIVNQDTEGLFDYLNESTQVFICSSCGAKVKASLVKYCAVHNVDCAIIPSMEDIVINSGKVGNINDLMILNMDVKMDIETKLAKRLMDIALSFLGIIIASPIMVFVFFLILIQDGGNPIYTQKRLSRGNRVFTIYKFRTMVIDAEKETGAVLATDNDARITKLGKVLRASRIDELPQLFNVLRGDMSIVGPRPERPDLVNQIGEKLPEFKYRTLVKPGLTGYAQVLGRYDTDFKDKLRFDLYYVNNYSMLLDLRIMFHTIRILFTPSVTQGISLESEDGMEAIIKSEGYNITYKVDRIICNKNNDGL
jgi:exopolysaccharide biosynthesis polyprenyl glycosylphosphotransferase